MVDNEVLDNEFEEEIEVNKEKKPFSFLKRKYESEEDLVERKKKRKSITALSVLVLILAAGVMGNWYYQNTDVASTIEPLLSTAKEKALGEAELVNATTTANDESSYFSSARLERQNARDESLEKLQSVIDKTDKGDDAYKTAAKEIALISKNISTENKIETLVCAKGIENCLAVISSDSKRIDIIVDSKELTDTQILQIKDIATSQLGCSFENVSIIQSK